MTKVRQFLNKRFASVPYLLILNYLFTVICLFSSILLVSGELKYLADFQSPIWECFDQIFKIRKPGRFYSKKTHNNMNGLGILKSSYCSSKQRISIGYLIFVKYKARRLSDIALRHLPVLF